MEGFARVIARSREVSGVLGQRSLRSLSNFSSFSKIIVNIDIFISFKFNLFSIYFYDMLLVKLIKFLLTYLTFSFEFSLECPRFVKNAKQKKLII